MSEVVADQMVGRLAMYVTAHRARTVKARGTILRSVEQPDRSIRFYLFYGPDEAGSRGLAERLLRASARRNWGFPGVR